MLNGSTVHPEAFSGHRAQLQAVHYVAVSAVDGRGVVNCDSLVVEVTDLAERIESESAVNLARVGCRPIDRDSAVVLGPALCNACFDVKSCGPTREGLGGADGCLVALFGPQTEAR